MELARYTLDGNADAVEFCPCDSFHDVLAAATYTLKEGIEPARLGGVTLFSVDRTRGLKLLHAVETTGVFDIKWSPIEVGMRPLLAQANADGCLRIHALDRSSGVAEDGDTLLREISCSKISSFMCLCVDWNQSATSMVAGLSDGSLSVIAQREADLEISKTCKAHDYEVWTASFDKHQEQLLYTGSDDCRFCCWDLRESVLRPVFQNRKTHTMGVCSIAKSCLNSNLLLTGSYDEFLRLWDIRSISKPINENSLCLGGGVWKLKFHHTEPSLVLAACMHNGFAIVRVNEDNIQVLETYKKHGSLAYGADWQRKEDGSNKESLIATCSFYDQLVHVWVPQTQTVG